MQWQVTYFSRNLKILLKNFQKNFKKFLKKLKETFKKFKKFFKLLLYANYVFKYIENILK